MKKTEEDFWAGFWANLKFPQIVNYNLKNDRVISDNIVKYIPKANLKKKVLEIGCAPGKWLVLFYEKLGYHITGIEYVDIAARKTIENFQILNIPEEAYAIQIADFLAVDAVPEFDVVFSLGFIEHFDNWDAILDKHIKFCKPGAHLLIGLPNFRGINYIIQKIIDNNTTDTKLLPIHNLNIMDTAVLRDYAEKRGLEIIKLDYVGGFEPALFNTNAGNKFVQFILKCAVKTGALIFGNLNTSKTSSYILGVFKVK
ncbi:class I SAM-dependent methyltransferase [Mucilaginibacter mali]|uniref:Class I SAM-dependent methyltransferase n=1 Tax=Mucilaginibacter mali TaxID=2740462 RepID=A0A7D4Q015_9SPHI|nr:class I SAM-dependent methyltransferase [Mucilaginibacter mali]QKJ29406.1 class I SAM-dependent methyltransferase [Mucilaginibacter mali]